MISTGAPALGSTVIGWAGTQFGVQPPLLGAAILGLIVYLFARPLVRRESGNLESGYRGRVNKQPAG
jgi:hypothetical protein